MRIKFPNIRTKCEKQYQEYLLLIFPIKDTKICQLLDNLLRFYEKKNRRIEKMAEKMTHIRGFSILTSLKSVVKRTLIGSDMRVQAKIPRAS